MNRLLYILGLFCFTCGAFVPAPVVDTDNNVDLCGQACTNMAELRCAGWQGSPGEDEIFGTPDDYSCEYICNLIEPQPEVNLNLECVIAATNCEEYESCY